MLYVHWLILIIYAIICIFFVLTVLLDKKEPSKTFAWLLLLYALPVIGFVLYLFFGRNHRKEKQQKRVQRFLNQEISVPYKNNNVKIFCDGASMFSSLLTDIASAKEHVHLETYIFADDKLGNRVADALIERAREGVSVRVLFDDVGSFKTRSKFFNRMRKAGVEVRSFMPVRMPRFASKINYRNHRKLCIVDGRIGYIGGMNIADRYVDGIGDLAWRDTHLRIIGTAVYGIQRTFLIDWFTVDSKLLYNRKFYPPVKSTIVNECTVRIASSSCVSHWPNIMQGYVRIISNATKYIFIETPYFLPPQPVLFALQTAALSGVDVRVIVPARGNNAFIESSSRSFFAEVMKSGVKIYLYKAGFNHSKLMVADDFVCTVGSANIDTRSFENNMEVNAFIIDDEIAKKLRFIVEQDLKQSEYLSFKRYSKTKFHVRLWESIVRMLSPLF